MKTEFPVTLFFSFPIAVTIFTCRADAWKDPFHDGPVHSGLTNFGKVGLWYPYSVFDDCS